MKRLKHRHPFRGRGLSVFYIGLFISMPIFMLMHMDFFSFIAALMCMFLVAFISYHILNRLDDEECEKIEYAEELKWNYCSDDIIKELTARKSVSLKMIIIFLVADILITLLVAYNVESDSLPVVFLVAADIFIVFMIIVAVEKARWGRVDNNAEYACPKVDHFETVKFRTKHGTQLRYYAVFYLPDGRYMLSANSSDSIKKLYLIRFMDNYTYFFA